MAKRKKKPDGDGQVDPVGEEDRVKMPDGMRANPDENVQPILEPDPEPEPELEPEPEREKLDPLEALLRKIKTFSEGLVRVGSTGRMNAASVPALARRYGVELHRALAQYKKARD